MSIVLYSFFIFQQKSSRTHSLFSFQRTKS
nr:MAG TPA: hypothetical protein [Caudoviricetes sp.]